MIFVWGWNRSEAKGGRFSSFLAYRSNLAGVRDCGSAFNVCLQMGSQLGAVDVLSAATVCINPEITRSFSEVWHYGDGRYIQALHPTGECLFVVVCRINLITRARRRPHSI
jgi:hypothetical protein